MAYRLLVIGGDPRLMAAAKASADVLTLAVNAVSTGTQGLREVERGALDVVLLDTELSDIPAPTWLQLARGSEAGAGLPILAAWGRRSDEEMALMFELGADDYLAKDCEVPELTARLRAALRRRFERQEQLGSPMQIGPIQLDPRLHECRVRGRRVNLRPREFELLEILMRKAGRVLNRPYLLETVWGMSGVANTRAVDVGVSRLRLNLGKRAGAWVETVERFGYRYRRVEDHP